MPDYSPWLIEESVTFLNHGSFGGCPAPVLEAQDRMRRHLECQPVRFFTQELPGLLAAALEQLSDFLGAGPPNLAFVPNATAGVNTVLRSLDLSPGDELLITDHAYGACRNALEFTARRTGARLVVARIPFPIGSPAEAEEAVLSAASPRTRLALLDHVTSPTALVLPMASMVRALEIRGVDTLVDGAHAPGMIPLNLEELGAAYYTGNCHKWLCAPKGAGFLWVRPDRQRRIRPLSISHGAGVCAGESNRFRLEMDWTGTHDPTPYLTVPEAIHFMGSLLPGKWPALMQRNHTLVLKARTLLARSLGIPLPCPDEMVGSMASLPLPPAKGLAPIWPEDRGPLQRALFNKHNIEVPIITWPVHPAQVIRISAQYYNQIEHFDTLAKVIKEL